MSLKPMQVATIEAMVANPGFSMTKIAEIVGVNRNTVSKWKRNDKEFIEAYQKALREKWDNCEGIAIDTMRELALNGDYKASEFILKTMGYTETKKIEADINTNVIKITIEDDEEDA